MDIAAAVDGNNDGSNELEGEEAKGEVAGAAASSKGATSDDEAEMQQPGTVKKHHYRKQNRAQRNAALIYIVSTVINDSRNLQTYLDI